MALIDKASLLMVPSVYEDGTLYNVLPSGNKAPDETGNHNGYDQTRADFTFSRGANLAATRVNAAGLIEKGRENLLLQSNQFDTTWVNANSTETSGQADKDGGTNAWKIDISGAGGRVYQSVSQSGVVTFSVYAKKGTLDWVILSSNIVDASFNLATGEKGALVSGITSSIEDVGNGWYRCSCTGSGSFTQFRIYPAIADNTFTATSGNVIVMNAQAESSMVATNYIETTTTTAKAGVLENMPRIDYSSGAGALLLEPLRTNLLPLSEYFSSSVWTKDNSSVIDNSAISPEGVQNASLVYPTSSSSAKWGAGFYDFNSASNDTYTNTFYVKSNGWRWVYMIDPSGLKNAWFDLQNGVTGTAESPATSSIESLGNDWYRCSVSSNITHTYTYCGVYFSDADNSYVCTPSGTNGVYAYGGQSESGSYHSSYIPTMGTAASRAADSCSVTGASDVIGQSEGTLYADFIFDGKPTSIDYNIMILGAIGSNYINIGGYNTSLYARVFNSTLQGTINALQMVAGTRYKVAVAYANNDVVMYVNGANEGTDTSASIPAVSQIGFSRPNFEAKTNILNAQVYKERLTNTELATLTTL